MDGKKVEETVRLLAMFAITTVRLQIDASAIMVAELQEARRFRTLMPAERVRECHAATSKTETERLLCLNELVDMERAHRVLRKLAGRLATLLDMQGAVEGLVDPSSPETTEEEQWR